MAVAAVSGGARRRFVAPLVLAAFAAFVFFAPFGVGWPCPLKTLAGIPCPTCGMTRAARLVAHGDFAGATRMHPLWFLVLPLLAALVSIELVSYVRTGAWGAAGRIRAVRVVSYVTVALLMIVWIARFLGAFGGPAP